MGNRLVHSLAILAGVLQFLIASAGLAQTEQRVALVIGNSAYKESPLANPGNDAADMAKALHDMGFKVILRRNVKTGAMRNAIREFGQELRRAQVGLFYYAGHGVQIKGNNYLVPVGTDIRTEADVEDQSIDANYVLRTMEEAQAKVNIVILDACRNNPYMRSFRSATRGLGQMSAATGTLIAFSTAPGSVAEDGTGRNSIYTQHLLANLRQPDTDILKVFQRTRAGVVKDTGGKQTPWELNSLVGDFLFRPASGQTQLATTAPSASEIRQTARPASLAPLAAPSSAELDSPDFLEETEAYLKQTPAAVTELRRLADSGDSLAQARWCAVSTHERYNLGLPPADGIALCRRLAEEGLPIAMFLYGRAYLYGRGIAKDGAEAEKWVRQSAEKGNALGINAMGALYLHGIGVPKDEAEAFRWFSQSAEKGFSLAMVNLANMYGSGSGIAKSDAEAVKWYRRAAEKGNGNGMLQLAGFYFNGSGVAKDDSEAIKWYRMAAEKGVADAMNAMGYMYDNGRGVAKDNVEANKWYRMAAEKGDARAMANLGVSYANGEGVAKDEAEAVKWYQLAAGKGEENAMNNLGFMYEHGRGVAKDEVEAVKWYRMAAEKGSIVGMRNLAKRYEYGGGIQKDIEQAVQWYRKAADKGDDAAAKALARLGR